MPQDVTPVQWRARRAVARQWRDAANKRGGDVTLMKLPALGIRGDTRRLDLAEVPDDRKETT
jgi:hypothetical protein